MNVREMNNRDIDMTDMKRYENYLEKALALKSDTYSTQAAKKDVLSYLSRAYEALRGYEFDAPFELHQIRDRHLEIFGDLAENVQNLVSLRNEVKDTEVVKAMTKAEKQKLAFAAAFKTPIGLAVEPLRAEAIRYAGDQAKKFADKFLKKFEEAGSDAQTFCPYPCSINCSREEYQNKLAKRSLLMSLTSPVKTDRYGSRRMNDPEPRVRSKELIETFVQNAELDAAMQYDMFVLKLVEKAGEHVKADLTGNHIWSESYLRVEDKDGNVTTWKTQTIINFSKYGKMFNQFPTRKVK